MHLIVTQIWLRTLGSNCGVDLNLDIAHPYGYSKVYYVDVLLSEGSLKKETRLKLGVLFHRDFPLLFITSFNWSRLLLTGWDC